MLLGLGLILVTTRADTTYIPYATIVVVCWIHAMFGKIIFFMHRARIAYRSGLEIVPYKEYFVSPRHGRQNRQAFI